MREVWHILRSKGTFAFGKIVGKVDVEALTHAVEAVHEVDAVDGGDVSRGTVAPAFWDADGFRGIFA